MSINFRNATLAKIYMALGSSIVSNIFLLLDVPHRGVYVEFQHNWIGTGKQ